MANWQTPKTDWATEDGVMNTDFNRIEENAQYLYEEVTGLVSTVAEAAMTIHVSAAGSDTAGDGTSSSPYKSISKALSVIPKNLNGKNITISINSGIYAETVIITGFHGGRLILTSPSGTVTVTGFEISDGSVVVSNTPLSILTGGMWINYGSVFYTGSAVTVTGASTGVHCMNGSIAVFYNLTLDDCSYGMNVSNAASATATTIGGSGIITGIMCSYGGTATFRNAAALDADTMLVTLHGGRIYSGAQTQELPY